MSEPTSPATPLFRSTGNGDISSPDSEPMSGDPWGATHLSAPPEGSLACNPDPWDQPGSNWAPGDTPKAPSGFSPPEERGSIPAAEIPLTPIVVPKPIHGQPIDSPSGGRFKAPDESKRVAPKRRAAMFAIAGVVLLLLGLLGYYLLDRYRPVNVSPEIVLPASAQANAPRVVRGDLAVKGYLAALAAGDIDRALSFGPVGGGSHALLVPEALKASLELAPLTNINVAAADATASTIHASYQLGTQAVEADYKVEKLDDGNWQLTSSTKTVRLEAKRSSTIPLIINGQTIGPVVELELVPGTYTMTTGLPYLSYQSTTKITVPDLSYAKTIADLPVDVTEEGKQALIRATQESLASCIGIKQLSPANCPLNEPTNRPVIESTIKRELLVADPVSGAQWVIDTGNASIASALIKVHYRISASYDANSTTGWTEYNQSWIATVDASKTSSSGLSIQWSH